MNSDDLKNKSINTIANLDKIMHEPSRLMIMTILNMVEEMDFIFLRNQTGFTKGNLSSHLIKLEGSEYVEIKKEFVEKISRTTIKITQKGIKALADYRKSMNIALGNVKH